MTVTTAAANRGSPNKSTSSSGVGRRRSTTTNNKANPTPAATPATVSGWSHPRCGASSNAITTTAIAAAMITDPAQSTGGASTSRDRGTARANTATPTAATPSAQQMTRQSQNCS